MKIRAFKLDCADPNGVDNLLGLIEAAPIGSRTLNTASGEVSLKVLQRSRVGDWLLDFTMFRHTGPGKAPRDAPNEDFELGEDEYFGEETAAVYLKSTSHLIVQYNHYGPRSSSIEQYLQGFVAHLTIVDGEDLKPVALIPIMRADQVALYNRMSIVRKLSFKMYVPGALQIPSTQRASLSSVLSSPVVQGAQTINVEVKAGRSGQLALQQVRAAVSDLLGMSQEVTDLTVTGTDDPEHKAIALDLLGAQLQTERPIASTSKKRHALDVRWSAIRSAIDEWRDGGHL